MRNSRFSTAAFRQAWRDTHSVPAVATKLGCSEVTVRSRLRALGITFRPWTPKPAPVADVPFEPPIEFEDVATYLCPTCGRRVTYQPCPACVARGRRPDVAQTVDGMLLADAMLVAAGKRGERQIDQARHEGRR